MSGLIRKLRYAPGSFSFEVLQSFATNLAIALLGVLSGVLAARLLGPERRGELAAIQALPLLIGAVGQLGLHEAVIYFGRREPMLIGKYAVSGAGLALLLGIPILSIGVWITPMVLKSQSSDVVLASQLFLLVLFANSLHGVWAGVARAGHRISLWNVLRLQPPLLWAVLLGMFFLWSHREPVHIALVYLAAYSALSAFLIWPVRTYLAGHWLPDPKSWPSLLRYGLPLAAGAAPQLVSERLDQLLIASMRTPYELGLYAVAASWSGLAILPAMAISTVAFSKIAGLTDFGDQLRFVRKAFLGAALASATGAILLALATPSVIELVFGPEFAEATTIAFILLVAIVMRGCARMLQVGMQSMGRPSAVMWSEWAGLLVIVPTALALAPRLGATGVALSTVASSTAVLVAIYALLHRMAKSLAKER